MHCGGCTHRNSTGTRLRGTSTGTPATRRACQRAARHALPLLRAGVHPKIVSEQLGHATVSITLEVYSHAVPTLQREAAGRLASLVYGGKL
jgi:integrase